jgi:hypothetical protein
MVPSDFVFSAVSCVSCYAQFLVHQPRDITPNGIGIIKLIGRLAVEIPDELDV